MKVHVPYTELREATRIFLTRYTGDVVYHDVSGDGEYLEYWKIRWTEGLPFINLEHDVVPWPGAIEEIERCAGAWCVFGYTPEWDCFHGTAPFGLVKFSRELIEATALVWDKYERERGRAWNFCDSHFFAYAQTRGIHPHQHFPAVLNANPKVLA